MKVPLSVQAIKLGEDIVRQFIKGMDLCEDFYNEIAKPILNNHFPGLQYTAGLLGYGSDVLGFDDETSTDHMWGPRFYLFLPETDIKWKNEIMDIFSREFPYEYRGYSVNFSSPDPNDKMVRISKRISDGPVSPLIIIHTINEYLKAYLGTNNLNALSSQDWLSFSEHRLLALTSGKLFIDNLNIKNLLAKIGFYPEQVKLYLIASNWSLIAEEQAFVKRCSDVGDEIGSILACSRIAERLMRLAFLYCNQYAPYSKWFGTAFQRLPVDPEIKQNISRALTAKNIQQREYHLVHAQKLMADWHNSLNLTEFVPIKIENYFSRHIQVIFADKLAKATVKKLQNTELENYPLIGTLSEIANFAALTENLFYQDNVKALYQPNTAVVHEA